MSSPGRDLYWKIWISLFLLGWVTYIFALVNIGPISLTTSLLVASFFSFEATRARYLFSGPLISILLSTLLAWSVSIMLHGGLGKPTMHLIQAVLALGVMSVAVSLNWHRAFYWVQKSILILALVSLIYAIYQFFARSIGLPFAFLPVTNAQIGSDAGFQRGYIKVLDDIGFTRVSAFFAEPSDLGRFMVWVFCFAILTGSKKVRIWMSTIALMGILISQSFGAVVALACIFLVLTVTFRSYKLFFQVLGSIVTALIAVGFLAPQVIQVLVDRGRNIVLGGFYSLALTGRFRDLADAWDLIWERPLFGYGLASIGPLMPGKVLSDSYTILMFERGLVGSLLFFLPFFMSTLMFFWYRDSLLKEPMFRAAYLVGVAEIFFFFTFGQIYFTPLYFALGFQVYCLRTAMQGNSERKGASNGSSKT